MDSIYSNKKYLQSLNSADYYRTSTLRPSTTDYNSYNTMGGRSQVFGPYCKYSYPTDVSLSSHYGYTSWGLWRDTRNLSPSIYSKKRINIRSFSILLMSAAFIVVLAVLSVAALAFYFSTFKSDPSESILVFDCAFRISKGDVYTSGLRYNHTGIYRQKMQLYEKFIGSSLEHGGFTVSKTEIYGFGNGPDIVLNFRIYLDMRRIQMTITNVEEHIKNAFISETAATDSIFRHLKIDPDTIEIKRLLDQEILKTALSYRETTINANTMSTTVIPLDELPQKKSTPTQKPIKSKPATTKAKTKDQLKPIQESDIDMENLPVIQGSFEITKTEADIAQKKSEINNVRSTVLSTSTLKPFYISPATIKIKPNEKQPNPNVKLDSTENIVEKFLQHQQQILKEPVTAKIEKTNKKGETTVAKARPTLTTTTTTTTTTSTTTKAPTTTQKLETTTTTQKPITTSTAQSISEVPVMSDSEVNQELPKLDVSLFTSAPILEKSPWKPINPTNFVPAATPMTSAPVIIEETTISTIQRNPFKPPVETIMYRNKFVDPENIRPASGETTNGTIFYQSYTNPKFSVQDYAIERLGIVDVRPFPLPVNKIDINENVKHPENDSSEVENSEENLQVSYNDNKFEHLGGGVIAKKPELSVENVTSTTTTSITTTTVAKLDSFTANVEEDDDEDYEDEETNENGKINITVVNVVTTVYPPTKLGDIFLELLNEEKNFTKSDDDDKLESRISPDEDVMENLETVSSTTEKLNFINIKDYIVSHQKTNKTSESEDEMPNKPVTTVKSITTTILSTTTKKPTVGGEVPQLFPSMSKWEFVNGTRMNTTENSVTRKVFNETLQAVIVENSQFPQIPPSVKIETLKSKMPNATNLQQLSSIFDTLAAKLGIKPDVSNKAPPFSQQSQNKLKTGNRTRTPVTNRNKQTTTTTTIKPTTYAATTEASTFRTMRPDILRKDDVVYTQMETSSETIIGEAEVEAIDPTQYEEILSLASKPVAPSTTTKPALVTLLPVKSNSGIRNFNPRLKFQNRNSQSYVLNGEPNNMETVVKTSMSFDS